MLSKLGFTIGLDKYIIISKQIEDNDGRKLFNLIEDCFEAFVGAMFIDNNNVLDKVYGWFINIIETTLDFTELILSNTNYKEMLFKYYQHTYAHIPTFHESTCANGFSVIAKNNKNIEIGRGFGKTKKIAENDCVQKTLLNLKIM
jgi:dsRNA-specific ribonuclease